MTTSTGIETTAVLLSIVPEATVQLVEAKLAPERLESVLEAMRQSGPLVPGPHHPVSRFLRGDSLIHLPNTRESDQYVSAGSSESATQPAGGSNDVGRRCQAGTGWGGNRDSAEVCMPSSEP